MSDRKHLLESKEEAGQRSCWIRTDAEEQQQDALEQGQKKKHSPCPQGLRPQTRNGCAGRTKAERQAAHSYRVGTGLSMLSGDPVFP